jgi:Peptidase_C39 like family
MTRTLLNTFTSKKAVVGTLATVITGLGLAAGPAAAHAAAAPPTAATAHVALATTVANNSDHGNASKQLAVDYEAQPNFYWCGPAAARNALTADGHNIAMADLARQMGTTEEGTNSANDITAALNKVIGGDKYHTTELAKPTVSAQQTDTVKHDIVATIDDNRAVVANVAGTATDTDGIDHSYDGGHYIAVNGYRDNGNQVLIADSANPDTASYWINTADLANWMATRGYSH